MYFVKIYFEMCMMLYVRMQSVYENAQNLCEISFTLSLYSFMLAYLKPTFPGTAGILGVSKASYSYMKGLEMSGPCPPAKLPYLTSICVRFV